MTADPRELVEGREKMKRAVSLSVATPREQRDIEKRILALELEAGEV